ncbi:hypothetical protein ACFL6W_02330 [Thermodesulfobacteriota bacterium]
MKKVFIIALILWFSVVIADRDLFSAQSAGDTADPQFRVLSPWAEADPITSRRISPRLSSLAGKKIGLFANFKRASRPIVAEVEKRLKSIYPDCETSLFDSRGANVLETDTENREQFITWVKGVDAVVLAVGD